MTWREFLEWQAWYSIEPWGAKRGDLQAGIVASVIANALGGKSGKTFTPNDFVLEFEGPPEQQTQEQMMAMCFGIHKRLGGA